MAKKGGLGRGFESLFAENSADTNAAVTIRLSEIEPNRNQPRKEFDEEALQELADSISKHGLLQPLLVRPIPGGGYQLVAGERRWRASRMAGLSEVPAVVREMADGEAMELAMIENLQREDLNPIEEAAGYKYLMDNFGLTQEQVAETCTKSRSAVANAVRLLLLPNDILELIKIGELTAGHGRAILAINDEEMREQAVKMAQQGASVRELERFAQRKKSAEKPKAKTVDTFLRETEIALKESIGRRVKITAGNKKDSGTITIEYFSKEDLAKLAEKLSN